MSVTRNISREIFRLSSPIEFNALALKIFHYQYAENRVYRQFVDFQTDNPQKIKTIQEIPFLPIEFFKSHKIISGEEKEQQVFLSSGTTGMDRSKHFIVDPKLYEESFSNGFKFFYGSPKDYRIFALLPSYLERDGSSLIYMVKKLMDQSGDGQNDFFLDDYQELSNRLKIKSEKKTLLIGVSFALLEFAEKHPFAFPDETIVMETGGMKGRRREMIREKLHEILCTQFQLKNIHSEYGMTELMSQAYSKGKGVFRSPPWMKILIRDMNDPKSLLRNGKTGGINVIDLANIHSCSFIATMDLGRKLSGEEFEVLGRFDNSDIRGCNLMVV
jgi:phenylacetate-coenzyme A ligase PaaK-like adenylate-forming protein